MQEDFHTFFIGSAEDYFDILNATYQSIKNADSTAIVVLGGMAGVMNDNLEFFETVFNLGGSNYFDVGNIHSINSDSNAINGPEYKEFLDQQRVDKPFWITEVELGTMDQEKEGYTETDMSETLIISFVKAFASGAEKIFHPSIMESSLKSKPGMENMYTAFQTMIGNIDYFTSVEKLKDGQYKFTVNGSSVYVLWGSEELNDTNMVMGQITIEDISGNIQISTWNDLILTDSPVFVKDLIADFPITVENTHDS
jgi:hypothetical protein